MSGFSKKKLFYFQLRRSVIVAGGTMQPISEFREQLFQNAGAELSRIIAFSCGHVIPPENILPIIVSEGPSGKKLDFSFEFRNSDAVVRNCFLFTLKF